MFFLLEGGEPTGVLDDRRYGLRPSVLILSECFKDRFLVEGDLTSSAKETRLSLVFILRNAVGEKASLTAFIEVSDSCLLVNFLFIGGLFERSWVAYLVGLSLVAVTLAVLAAGDWLLLPALGVSGVLCLLLICF